MKTILPKMLRLLMATVLFPVLDWGSTSCSSRRFSSFLFSFFSPLECEEGVSAAAPERAASVSCFGGGASANPIHRNRHPCECCRAYVWHASPCLATLSLICLFIYAALTMYKVLRSYSKKAERKHEVSSSTTRDGQRIEHQNGSATYGMNGGGAIANGGGGGQVAQLENRHLSSLQHGGGGFSESSSYETREHFERKVQRVKKTRSERERSRSQRRGSEVG